MKRRRWTTTAEEAGLVFAGMTRTGTVMPDVGFSDVSVIGSVRCTEHDTKAARALALEHFPGKVLMIMDRWVELGQAEAAVTAVLQDA